MQKIQSTDKQFHDGDGKTVMGTVVTAKFLNDVQNEICNVIDRAGIDLDAADDTQLLQALLSVLRRGKAADADKLDGKPGTVYAPPGAVITFAASAPPVGWLECDGAAISRTKYSDLFNVIGTTFGDGDGATTFDLPDLRGEFIRGFDHGRGIDSNRSFGTAQISSQVAYDDDEKDVVGALSWVKNPKDQYGYETAQIKKIYLQATKTGAGSGYHTSAYAASIRPRNLSLLYCIKY